MNFDRYRLQAGLESILGCGDVAQWSGFKTAFINHQLTPQDIQLLSEAANFDAADTYYKGLLTLSDAIGAIGSGFQSWAVIKLYYSVFYFLRCYIYSHNKGIVKNNGIFLLDFVQGAGPVKYDKGRRNGVDVKGDHKTVIKIMVDLFGGADFFQSNQIDGKLTYDWMMDMREVVNYRERVFHEPNCEYFDARALDNSRIGGLIAEYCTDENKIHCFQEDHALLALPCNLAIEVKNKMSAILEEHPLSESQIGVLKSISKGYANNYLEYLFDQRAQI